MGIIRNFIDIIGITPEEDLPRKINGQLIEYSEVDYISIPENKPRIENLHQISIKIDTQSTRTINAPTGKIIVIDGLKKLKLIYTQRGHSDKANVLNIELPYNTFIDLPENIENAEKLSIYIVDTYFELLNSRKIYCYILYMVHANYSSQSSAQEPQMRHSLDETQVNINSLNTTPTFLNESSQTINEMSLSQVPSEDPGDYDSAEAWTNDLDYEYL